MASSGLTLGVAAVAVLSGMLAYGGEEAAKGLGHGLKKAAVGIGHVIKHPKHSAQVAEHAITHPKGLENAK